MEGDDGTDYPLKGSRRGEVPDGVTGRMLRGDVWQGVVLAQETGRRADRLALHRYKYSRESMSRCVDRMTLDVDSIPLILYSSVLQIFLPTLSHPYN